MCSRTAGVVLLAVLCPAAAIRAQDGGQLTAAEALALAFPDAVLRREAVTLDTKQQERAKALAGTDAPVTLTRHVASSKGKIVGTAYLDTRRVRTHGQTLLVVVDPAGKVARIEVLAFAEPRRYLPRPAFFTQFVGKGLRDGVQLRRGIRPVAGATLSARATTDAVRVVLAVHEVAGPPKPEEPTPAPGPRPGGGGRQP